MVLQTLEVDKPIHGQKGVDFVIDVGLQIDVGWHRCQVICLDLQDLQDLIHVDEQTDYCDPLGILLANLAQEDSSEPSN